MGLHFNTLLVNAGIAPEEVAVILHTAREPGIRKLMPLWARQRSPLLDTYQSTHSRNPEATLKSRQVAASFVNLGDRSFMFLGLYENRGGQFHSFEEIDARPDFQALYDDTDAVPFCSEDQGGAIGRLVFDLLKIEVLTDLEGRLRVAAPDAPRPYIRKGENLSLRVLSITEDGYADSPLADWRVLTMTKAEIDALPPRWSTTLSQWRGIYLIVDEADGARYVGSAYGGENLLGRWREHVRGKQGVTVELRNRDPRQFRFSILQRVSPDMQIDEIVPIENSWKLRLHTIKHGLNSG